MRLTLKHSYIISALLLLCGSCIDNDRDLNMNSDKEPLEDVLDTSFDFSLKSEKEIIVTTINAEGIPQSQVLVGVFAENPYEGDGVFKPSVQPIMLTYTDTDGTLTAKLPVYSNLSSLFVVPMTSGYGAMQEIKVSNYMSVQLVGATFPTATTSHNTRSSNRIATSISNLYQLYTIYSDSEVDRNGIPIVGASSLISKELLSPVFVNKVNSIFPELQNVQKADLHKSSDLIVTDENGAEVWITYIGDGGFSINNKTVYNSLYYYNYEAGELKDRGDILSLRMTQALPNTNEVYCPSGLRIQLLYWDKATQQYSTIFPKGSYIGFAAARKGYKKDGSDITVKGGYSFVNTSYPMVGNNCHGFYFSTPQLNFTNTTQAVAHVIDEYNCIVSGFDIRRSDDPASDFDFNDILFKITSSPVLSVRPEDEFDIIDEYLPTEAIHGTLAFEDQWPYKGDYDFNDVVVNYTYSMAKNTDNTINKVKLSFTPIAKGAANYTRIGFGIEIPIDYADVDLNSVTGASVETGNEYLTLIVWDMNNQFFGNQGFVNTDKGVQHIDAETIEVEIALRDGITNLSFFKFNPFIFVNERGKEIHLVDYKPTAKMNYDYFKQGHDNSDVTAGVYYRMDNLYPWVLDFPRLSSDSPAWRYPKEKSNITNAYLFYNEWVKNRSNLYWFDANAAGNVNEEELY